MTSHLSELYFVKEKQEITQSKKLRRNKFLKDEKKMSESEYSEHKSENSFRNQRFRKNQLASDS